MQLKPVSINFRLFQKSLLRLIINLQFAISLFFLISFYGVCGSILEQEQPRQYYLENYNLAIPLLDIKVYKIIFALGLDHIFTTYWFYILIILFGLSLISCSFLRQLPLFLFSRGNKFFYKANIPKNFQVYKTFKIQKIFSLSSFLSNENYLIFQKRGTFYSYKGLLAKFAPLVVHFSLILILAGTVIASLTSFSAQELVPKSETFTIQNTVRKNYLSFFPNSSIRVNDFWITYDQDENIKQYFSDISVLNELGEEEYQKVISVNKPLSYKGMVIYQTDWDLIAIRLKFNNGIKQIPLRKLDGQKKVWISSIELNERKIYFLVNNLNGYVSLYDERGKLIKQLELFQEFEDFKIIDIIPRTGLQLKIDKGIPILYLGFLFLMISVIFSSQYFPELWTTVTKQENNLSIVGKTNRQQLTFDNLIFL